MGNGGDARMSVYSSDVGLGILVPVSTSIASAVAAYLDCKKPISKTSITWTVAASGYDSSTLYWITTTSSNGGLDEVGTWTIQPRVVFGAASSISLHGSKGLLTVYDPI